MRRTAAACSLAAGCCLLSGCGSLGPDSDEAARAAEHFYAGLESGAGADACALVSPGVSESLRRSEHKPCASAIAEQGLEPAPGSRLRVDAYGDVARVVFEHDVAFLAVFDGEWRITAAGCTPDEAGSYDCLVEGG